MILDSLYFVQYLFLDFFDYFYHLFGMMHYLLEIEIIHFSGKLTIFMEM